MGVLMPAEVAIPDIAVRIELNERQRAVRCRQRAQLGQRDAVIAADPQRDHAGVGQRAQRSGDRRVAILDKAGHHRRVAVIHDRQRLKHLDIQLDIVRPQHMRGRAHRLGAKARADLERRAGVERQTDHGDIDILSRLNVRQAREGAHAGEARRGQRVGRLVAQA